MILITVLDFRNHGLEDRTVLVHRLLQLLALHPCANRLPFLSCGFRICKTNINGLAEVL